LWAYWPRKVVALEGQHKERVTNAFLNVTPWSANKFCVLGMNRRSSGSISSVSMKSMLGLPPVWARLVSGWLVVSPEAMSRHNTANATGRSRPST
jgi:hypothetical protein